ncbi:uncharacterized protein LAJ45_06355 [Morchella importuna]|uniref:uncharacterized protein n=1 Tax=Morchella importuna TaxID=1174673 RepID=UPI001E8D9ECF|nr:uncharacterized protein LAJ45_06355 [Morchella importuna]KAH8149724.1 hypothetical protein LAJ45_06355 [Morchella importuna]
MVRGHLKRENLELYKGVHESRDKELKRVPSAIFFYYWLPGAWEPILRDLESFHEEPPDMAGPPKPKKEKEKKSHKEIVVKIVGIVEGRARSSFSPPYVGGDEPGHIEMKDRRS